MTQPDELSSMDLVTDVTTTGVAPELDRAVQAADAAARSAGVSVRELTDLAELDEVVDLFSSIWGRAENPPVTIELLRAFTKAGNYVGGAFDGGRLVGACVGFFHAPAEDALHSHIAGVSPAATGRSIGFALKLHQRAWALLRGVSEIAWTFDPLVSRNAYFNLVKLAAQPVEYLPNFYGPMLDTINGDDDSDRLLVRWRLRDPAVVRRERRRERLGGREPTSSPRARWSRSARPRTARRCPAGSTARRRWSPYPMTSRRCARPTRRWPSAGGSRSARRSAALVADGGRIDGFDRAGWYVVRRDR